MDRKKLNALRERVSIPMKDAIELLKKTNGDIPAAENEFHALKIKDICRLADCDEETAAQTYKLYNCDIEKAISKINNRDIIITTRDTLGPKNEIGYSLWPETKNGDCYKTVKRNAVFIPSSDFDYIIEEFKSVFPQKHPVFKHVEKEFDPCGDNHFSNSVCKQILSKIEQIKKSDPKIEKFLEEVKDWLNDKLEYADIIVVFGNL